MPSFLRWFTRVRVDCLAIWRVGCGVALGIVANLSGSEADGVFDKKRYVSPLCRMRPNAVESMSKQILNPAQQGGSQYKACTASIKRSS